MAGYRGATPLGALYHGDVKLGAGWTYRGGQWVQVYASVPPLPVSTATSTVVTSSISNGSRPCRFTDATGDAQVVTFNGPTDSAVRVPETWVDRQVRVTWGMDGLNINPSARATLSNRGIVDPDDPENLGWPVAFSTTQARLLERTVTVTVRAARIDNTGPAYFQVGLWSSVAGSAEVTPFLTLEPL